jgi:hypothetical protein
VTHTGCYGKLTPVVAWNTDNGTEPENYVTALYGFIKQKVKRDGRSAPPEELSMPYQTHSAFVEPKDRTARLWRYMDLPRLLSVLDKRALFFPSVATLSESDPYEGDPTLVRFRAAQAWDTSALRELRLQSAVFKHLNFFNCWHMNDGESDAMWKIYLHGSEGVAIQSTVERLITCFAKTPDPVYMGEVEYVDPNQFQAPADAEGRSLSDYMFKRLAFQHEKEVRVGTYRSDVRLEFFEFGCLKNDLGNVRVEDILLSPQRKGVYVDVDVLTLIEKVVVSPLSPIWFSDLVASLSIKLSYMFEVVPSEMSRPSPLFSSL